MRVLAVAASWGICGCCRNFELILVLLSAVIALHWLAGRIGLPPSAALLVGGGALAFLPGLPEVSLDPELALVLRVALLGPDAPSGTFTRRDGIPIPW